jgi:hypothetical protein
MRCSVKAPGKFLLSLSTAQNAGIGTGAQRLVLRLLTTSARITAPEEARALEGNQGFKGFSLLSS